MSQSCPTLKRPSGRISKRPGRVTRIIRRHSYQDEPFVQWRNPTPLTMRIPTLPVPFPVLETISRKVLPPLSKRREILVRLRKVVGKIPTHRKPPPHPFPTRHLLHLLRRLLPLSVDQSLTRKFVGWICLHLSASSIFLMLYIRLKARCLLLPCLQAGNNHLLSNIVPSLSLLMPFMQYCIISHCSSISVLSRLQRAFPLFLPHSFSCI